MSNQIKALEAFAADSDLLRLESLLKRFNLFEAIGVIRQELRHSDLLACLLDPVQSHGLGSIFLSKFLSVVQWAAGDESTLATLDLSALNLDGCSVLREWHHIDILVIDRANRLAIIIENKIDTKESLGQLIRYFEEVSHHANYQDYQIIALYLTPEGDEPSFDRYLPVSYTQVCEVIGQIIQNSPSKPIGEILVVMEHYAQLLRRHIVGDSEVAELCRSINQKHRKALDTIFEHSRSQPVQVGEYVKSLIEWTPTLDLGASGKGWIVFVPSEWNGPRVVTPQPPHLYFQFHNLPHELNIFCTLSPGDMEKRTRVFEMAQRHGFVGCQPQLKRGACNLFSFSILHADDYDRTQEEIEVIISEKWAAFLHDALPGMVQAVREEKWLWETP